MSLETRKTHALDDPGAEALDKMTGLWDRYGRIALGVIGAIVVVAGVAFYTIRQSAAQENLASRKLAEADLLFWQGEYDRARSTAGEVSKQWGSTPSGIDAHRVAGDAAYWRGDFKGAITEYKAYLAKKSSGVFAQSVRRSLAYSLDSDKQYAEAARTYDALVGVFDRETSAEMLASEARCLLATSDRAGATAKLQKLVDDFGDTSYANPARVQLAELGATGH